MLLIINMLSSVVFKMPYFTVIGEMVIVTVEDKSVFEKFKQHEIVLIKSKSPFEIF
jgi:hypothetical protein